MPHLLRKHLCLHFISYYNQGPCHLPLLFPASRPLQPKSFGAAHLAAVYLLTYLGTFCAALLGASYASQNVQQWQVGREGGQSVCAQLSGLHSRSPCCAS